MGKHFGRVNAENMKQAHALLESGRTRGNVVLEGFWALGALCLLACVGIPYIVLRT